MSRRLEALQRALQPGGRQLVATEIAALFLILVARNVDVSEARAVQRIYEEQLCGLPAFALKNAFDHARRSSDKFMPTPGQLYTAAENTERYFRTEAVQLREILTAKPLPAREALTADRRKQIVQEALRARNGEPSISAEMRAKDLRDGSDRQAADEAEAFLKRNPYKNMPAAKASPALLKILRNGPMS